MIEALQSVAAFIVAISLLIAVHEFGHFITARRLGVKVEKFSIGFGPSLCSWYSKDGEVEYIIAAIPLGGYVKMLGEMPGEEDIPEQDRPRAFDAQAVWKRACIATAGPVFNFGFAIIAYMMVGWVGQSVLPPVVGHVAPASAAEQSGIMKGDRLLAINGHEIHSWRQMEERLKNDVGGDVRINVQRGDRQFVTHVALPGLGKKDPILADVAAESLGINYGMKVMIDSVAEGSPAAVAGLKAGDQVLQAQGYGIGSIGSFIQEVRRHANKPLTLVIDRNGVLINIRVVPANDAEGYGRIGAKMMAQPVQPLEKYRMGLLDGITYGFSKTWEMTALTLQVLGKMVMASISPQNLGGPIAIAQLAGKTAGLGFVAFVSFLALISVNLGVLNLFPVPILDGGHLLYLGIEKLRGRPLSAKVLERTQIVGMSLIIILMVFAFYNDLTRLFRS